MSLHSETGLDDREEKGILARIRDRWDWWVEYHFYLTGAGFWCTWFLLMVTSWIIIILLDIYLGCPLCQE